MEILCRSWGKTCVQIGLLNAFNWDRAPPFLPPSKGQMMTTVFETCLFLMKLTLGHDIVLGVSALWDPMLRSPHIEQYIGWSTHVREVLGGWCAGGMSDLS